MIVKYKLPEVKEVTPP